MNQLRIPKKMMKRTLILNILILTCKLLVAQEFVVYNQYINNPFLYNPAWAGSTNYDELRCSYREQWTGITDAPSTQTISFQKKLNKVGLGAYLYHDKNGRTGYQGLEIAYSYHIEFSKYESVKKQNMLAFGLSLGMHHYKVDLNSLMAENIDPALVSANNSAYVPSMNFGIVYRNGNYSLGLSATQLLSKSVRFGDFEAESVKPATYYLYNSYDLKISSLFILCPSLLAKYNGNNEKQFDISLKTTYKGPFNTELWLSGTYRRIMDASLGASNAAVPSCGVLFNKLYFGYMYELGLSEIRSFNNGTHEITIGYNFIGTRGRNLKNPAYRPDNSN
jgi:type IX secretion system PorP/SprF family membrane protein